ncbi:M23 family metallopeptidase [Sphingosinicella sp. CPCC 101087]|uniref:M23 family metallopeptidase n=1 Tax=Sphingosinicella sp. CPCC 101087 TaxID=2497754 RepID=UPI00101C32A1|nr:M23 family metallopeptidase [Sphingosinicella sp. CPCC 101087]
MIFVVILLLVCIGMPLLYAWRVWRLDEQTSAAWLLIVVESALVLALVFLVGRWDIAGHYTRILLLAVFAAAVLRSLVKHGGRPWRVDAGPSLLRSKWTTMLTIALFSAGLAYVASGMAPPAGARTLAFPLRDGRFMVGQGGGIGLLNGHAGHRQQQFAADLTAIGRAGFRASGILPGDLDRYVIYGAAVVSPCEGTVLSARDGLPDLVPPQADPDNPAGNHVVIECGEVNVELAHLRRGSVEVAPGNRLAAGDPVGLVGNSGNTTEPHLHIHAVDPESGTGVPMSFGGAVPVRNRLYSG